MREVLFMPQRSPRQRQFTGYRLIPDKATADLLGIATVRPAPSRPQGLARELAKLLPPKTVLWVPAYRGRDDAFVREIRSGTLQRLQTLRTDISVYDLHPVLARMRSVKDPLELAALRRACTLTVEAFLMSLPAIRPGGSEAEVDGALLAAVRAQGGHPAYPFIVGAGANAAIPHYFRNEAPLRDGELLLIDAGAAFDRYAADVTRTFPISGKFTARQREIYEIVLRAQRAALAAVRVGATFRQIDAAARKVITDAGYGKHFIHGTCHHVGLDVHDPGPTRVQKGMTFTVEPGIYLPAERIGIRIEDVIAVTDEGVENLTVDLPKDPDEIERLLATSRKK
jgi:Xaa-Pro aminopeptidase